MKPKKSKVDDQITEIQSWLMDNVPNARTDPDTIRKFLSGCKNQTEKVKIKMRNFYEVRRTSPEIYNGRDPFLKNLDELLNLGAFLPLPVPTPEGHKLVLAKAGAHDPRSIPMTDVFKIGVMSVDLLMELESEVTRHGVGVLIDLKGVGLRHAMQMTPGLIRKMVHMWQDCYPIRIRSIDFVNVPPTVDVVLNIFRRFLNETLKRRLRTHTNALETLHEVLERRLLPCEYGGTLGPESELIEAWKIKVQEHREWFLNDDTLK